MLEVEAPPRQRKKRNNQEQQETRCNPDSSQFFSSVLLGLLLNPLGDSRGSDEPFEPQLFIRQVLIELPLSFCLHRKLVEDAIIGASEINGQNQSGRQAEDNNNEPKSGHRITTIADDDPPRSMHRK